MFLRLALVPRCLFALALSPFVRTSYRVGKSRIFFRAGHIAAIRDILGRKLPVSEAKALADAKALLKQ